jgi:hypothetical protein
MVYQIRIKGHLGRHRADWTEGPTITLEEDGDTLFSRPADAPNVRQWIEASNQKGGNP